MTLVKNVNESKDPKSFEEAISLTGFGKFNLFSLLGTGGSLMCVIVETLCASFIAPSAQCDLNLSVSQKGLLSSVGFLGVVASSQIWGYLADTKGRKEVVYRTLIVSAIFSFIGSLVTNAWVFIFLRFCNGFFIAGSSAIVYAYVGEFHDSHFRPKVVSWTAAFIGFGNMYVPGMAWLILSQHWEYQIPLLGTLFRPWRLLIIMYSLPSIIFAICVYFLPESPKFLLSQGRDEEVLKILRKMYRINFGRNHNEYQVTAILWDEDSDLVMKKGGLFKSIWEQTKPLFQRSYCLKTILISFLQFTNYLTSSAVMMWYPQILNSMSEYRNFVPSNEVTMCEAILFDNSTKNNESFPSDCTDSVNSDVFIVSLIVGFCYFICYIFMGSVISKLGPRSFSTGLLTMTSISGILAQTLNGYLYIQLTIGFFLMGACAISAVSALAVELYPTQIRGMALSISLMLGRLGAMTGSNAFGPLMYSYCDYMFYIFAAIHILFIICVIAIPSQKYAAKTITI